MRQTYDSAALLAGGTALLLAMERGQTTAETIIDLKRIKQLRVIEVTPEDMLKIGALVTLREIIDSMLVGNVAPVLAQTAKLMATPQVRNLGTIGGNIASGLAAADLVTTLLALNAYLLVATINGELRMSLEEFMAPTSLDNPQKNGIISAVILPRQEGRATYQRLMVRRAADVPLANVAVWIQSDSRHVVAVRLVAGSCGGRPARLYEAEAALHEQAITPASINKAASIATETVRQTGDRRASEAYRRRMVGVLTHRALTHLIDPL